jgi:hypothetical protein
VNMNQACSYLAVADSEFFATCQAYRAEMGQASCAGLRIPFISIQDCSLDGALNILLERGYFFGQEGLEGD